MEENKSHPWFKPIGFMRWQPVSWQGWLLILVFGVLVATSVLGGHWFIENMCLVDCELEPETEFGWLVTIKGWFSR
jgi:hypothetical protein